MKEIKFDPDQYFVPDNIVSVQGVRRERYVSPYNIPQAMSVQYNPQSGLLEIEIDYIIRDDKMRKEELEGVKLIIGKHSGRVYSLAMTITEQERHAPLQALLTRLEKAIEVVKAQQPDNGRRDSYTITSKVIHSHASDVFGSLAYA